jgi:hypothetical protein
MSDLLNVFKMNLNRIVKYRNQKGYQLHYNAAYKTVNRAHWIRTIVAHANDIDMSPSVFIDSLACLLDFSRLIGADGNLIVKLENDWRKYLATLPQEKAQPSKETMIKEKILSKIETRIILKAVNCDSLPADIKLSIDRTMLRLHSMRTLEEIVGFFNNAMRSERGKVVQNVLYNNGLLSFEDIKDEINLIYAEMLETED